MSVHKKWAFIHQKIYLAAITACSAVLVCPRISLLHLILCGSDRFIGTETCEQRCVYESELCFKSRKVRGTQMLQAWLLWCWWQFASRLSIYDFILLLIPFATEEAEFPDWYLILWQIQRWPNPWGTNKWVSKLSVLLCWHCISQYFTNFPGSCFSQLANVHGFSGVTASEVYSHVIVILCLFIQRPFDDISHSPSNTSLIALSSFQHNCISPDPLPPFSLNLIFLFCHSTFISELPSVCWQCAVNYLSIYLYCMNLLNYPKEIEEKAQEVAKNTPYYKHMSFALLLCTTRTRCSCTLLSL